MLRIIGRRFASSAATAPTAGGSTKVVSSCAAGTVLKGLNVRKTGEDPVALEDSEYPPWLWTLLDKKAMQQALQENPEQLAQKERRQANRQKIKMNNFLAGMKN